MTKTMMSPIVIQDAAHLAFRAPPYHRSVAARRWITHNEERRVALGDDRSAILVVSALDDNRRDILGCGETLSAVRLKATMAGLASCTLTNPTGVTATRDIVA